MARDWKSPSHMCTRSMMEAKDVALSQLSYPAINSRIPLFAALDAVHVSLEDAVAIGVDRDGRRLSRPHAAELGLMALHQVVPTSPSLSVPADSASPTSFPAVVRLPQKHWMAKHSLQQFRIVADNQLRPELTPLFEQFATFRKTRRRYLLRKIGVLQIARC